jgi:hypothetical protein
MVTAPAADELYTSAAKFAQSALDAHHKGEHQRVAIDAGTALEDLTKACLARRSPALLAELKPGQNDWESLVLLCGFPEGKPRQLRTVGLREAHSRLRTFVTSVASEHDLGLLIDLRDGVVHAALNEEVEERLLVAFVQQADAMLTDMDTKWRRIFWGEWSAVVTALVAQASDETKHRVAIKLAAAKAAFSDKYGGMSSEMQGLIGRVEPRSFYDWDEAATDCPACDSRGIAKGTFWLDEVEDYDKETGEPWVWGMVKFTPDASSCPLCGLRLTNTAELAEAGVPADWNVPEIDVAEFDAYQRQLDHDTLDS